MYLRASDSCPALQVIFTAPAHSAGRPSLPPRLRSRSPSFSSNSEASAAASAPAAAAAAAAAAAQYPSTASVPGTVGRGGGERAPAVEAGWQALPAAAGLLAGTRLRALRSPGAPGGAGGAGPGGPVPLGQMRRRASEAGQLAWCAVDLVGPEPLAAPAPKPPPGPETL